MTGALSPPLSARDRALEHCSTYVAWYQKVKVTTRRLDNLLQTSVISFSAVTPLLVLIEGLPPVLKALPATIAAIAAGLQGVFKYRERYLGFAMAGELLKAERLRFETRITALLPDSPEYLAEVRAFVESINRVVLSETGEWKRHLGPSTDTTSTSGPGTSEQARPTPGRSGGLTSA